MVLRSVRAVFLCKKCVAKGRQSALLEPLYADTAAPPLADDAVCLWCRKAKEGLALYYRPQGVAIGGYVGYASSDRTLGALPYNFQCELCGKNIKERDKVVRLRQGDTSYEGVVHIECARRQK